MRVLFVGDLVGEDALYALRYAMPTICEEFEVDFAIVNGENAAGGLGLTYSQARLLFSAGFDAITLGNHCWAKPNLYEHIEEESRIVRPLNGSKHWPGRGATLLKKGDLKLWVVSLLGQGLVDNSNSPFEVIQTFLDSEIVGEQEPIFVDFHAELTAEKRAMGYFLDGRVSAICGTHTHVQTADEQILPKGTAYLTDAGMTGVAQSVIGMRIENSIRRLAKSLPTRYELASGKIELNAVLMTLDNEQRRALSIERLKRHLD